MFKRDSVRQEWDSNDASKPGVTKQWDSADIKRRTAADRIRESAQQARTNLSNKIKVARQEAKDRRAYAKSPQGKAAALKEIKQQYQYESAKYKLAKTRGMRRKQQLDSLGMFGMGGGTKTNSGFGNSSFGQPSYSGFDSMFGFSGGQQPRSTRRTAPRKSGFDEMFGF